MWKGIMDIVTVYEEIWCLSLFFFPDYQFVVAEAESLHLWSQGDSIPVLNFFLQPDNIQLYVVWPIDLSISPEC